MKEPHNDMVSADYVDAVLATANLSLTSLENVDIFTSEWGADPDDRNGGMVSRRVKTRLPGPVYRTASGQLICRDWRSDEKGLHVLKGWTVLSLDHYRTTLIPIPTLKVATVLAVLYAHFGMDHSERSRAAYKRLLASPLSRGGLIACATDWVRRQGDAK